MLQTKVLQSHQEFKDNLTNYRFQNCPVTVADAKCAVLIYGPKLAPIKGHWAKGANTKHIPTFIPDTLPAFITKHHLDVTLCMDNFYVQKIGFAHTIVRKLQFRTVARPLPPARKQS